jgi:hypothetical protein
MRVLLRKVAVLSALAAVVSIARADLSAVRAESNLEKRSRLALEHADKTLDAARQSYREGDWEKVQTALDEVRESAEIALESLLNCGKDAARGSKYFKSAEIKTRELVRKLEAFRQQVSYDEQPPVEKVKSVVQKVHDDILDGIMGKKHSWGKK